MNETPCLEYLMHALKYNRRTGVFTWRNPTSRKVKRGDVAGTLHSKGYWIITVRGKAFLAHRLAWAFCHGRWPSQDVDHKNGIRLDNRLANLRDVSRQVNLLNQLGPSKNNKLGVLGVSQCRSKFKAQITFNGHNTYIGVYDTLEEASKAYKEAKKRLHTSKR